MTKILLDKLTKRYGKHIALKETNLELPAGKFIVFLGPSGCGKSTTLNCIAGFEMPTEGRVLFDGQDMTSLPPHARNIAMVFQSALLYPHLSARTNIEMSLKHSNVDASVRQMRTNRAVEMLHIGHLLDKRPSQLSGGERQRVALAKAMVREPSVFLMDEPFSALDAALRNSLRAEIVLLQKRLAVTTVFVTHDQVEAMTMGDIIVVMQGGVVQQVGTPREIYESPANRFVGGFIGSPPMNLVDGKVQQDGGRHRFVAQGLSVELPDAWVAFASKTSAPLCLGIRPHHVSLSSPERADVQAVVTTVENLGKESVILAVDGAGTTWRVVGDPYVNLGIGDKVAFKLNMEHAMLFDH